MWRKMLKRWLEKTLVPFVSSLTICIIVVWSSAEMVPVWAKYQQNMGKFSLSFHQYTSLLARLTHRILNWRNIWMSNTSTCYPSISTISRNTKPFIKKSRTLISSLYGKRRKHKNRCLLLFLYLNKSAKRIMGRILSRH